MEVVRRAPFLEPRARRAAKEHAAHGIVEVIEFDVRDVWKLISCSGPPWCPSTWLVKVDADAFVYMWSWDSLKEPADQMFPGTHVAVERLPKSGRILSARTSGPALTNDDSHRVAADQPR